MSYSLWQGLGGTVVRGDSFPGNHAPWSNLNGRFDWIALHEHDPFLDLEVSSARAASGGYRGKLLLWIIGTGDPVADAARADTLTRKYTPAAVIFEMEAPYKGNPNGTTDERARYAAAATLASEWRRRQPTIATAAFTLAKERFFDYAGIRAKGFRILIECYEGNSATPVDPSDCMAAIQDLVDRFYCHFVIACNLQPLSPLRASVQRSQLIGGAVYTIDKLYGWAQTNPNEWTALPAGPPVVAYR
jgi:hypothetical protein